jgi:phospholipase/carboxylesterase
MTLREQTIDQLACLVDDSSPRLSAVLVLAHGYAMQPEHLAPLACATGLPAALYFPRGLHQTPIGGRCWWLVDEPHRQASISQGPRDLLDAYPECREQARRAMVNLMLFVRSVHPGLPVVLAGFSQGGMLACDTLLREETHADALVLLSSSRIAIDEWRPRLHRLRDLPVLVAHGTRDADLSYAAGEGLRDELLAAGADVEWLGFDGGHETPLTVWRSVRLLVQKIAQRSQGT